MTDFDLVIRNGRLVTAKDNFLADIGISAGIITAIGQNLSGKNIIDATDRLVLPGAVDPHVHLEMPAGTITSSDDWESGSIAAAFGGNTTILDFVEPEGDQSLLQALASRRNQAQGHTAIDYGLHMTIARSDQKILEQIQGVVAAGVPSFKVYTTYDGFQLEDHQLLDAMLAVKAAGGLMMVHAENNAIIKHQQRKILTAGNISPHFHPLSRPDIAEAEAIHRVLALGEITGVHLYIVHISSARGIDEVARARARGQEVIGETCPQYLLLTDTEYDRPGFEGAKFVCSPPLRKNGDQTALWEALSQGEVKTIGTDHCPFFYYGQKDLGRDQFTKIPGGIPGIETRLALMFTFGVETGRISLNQWVDQCCTSPAQSFGIYPQKGSLTIGADADLVIFDPKKDVTITKSRLHEHVDYTPYEGLKLHGYPETTILRGNVLVRNGVFIGQNGQGRFLAGTPVIDELGKSD
ncbi:MAG: dihydropyrimidinase [Leptolinea sp.]